MINEEIKHRYIFPNIMAKVMSKVDLRTQYEASMMSMSLMMAGMILTVFYMVLYTNFQTWYKIVLVINLLAGFVFMTSFLITTFQQYKNYMEVRDFQNNLKGGANA